MIHKLVFLIAFPFVTCGCGKKSNSEDSISAEIKKLRIGHFFQDEEIPIRVFHLAPKKNLKITHKVENLSRIGIFVVDGDKLSEKYKNVVSLRNIDHDEYIKTYRKAARMFTQGEDKSINLIIENLTIEKITVIVYIARPS